MVNLWTTFSLVILLYDRLETPLPTTQFKILQFTIKKISNPFGLNPLVLPFFGSVLLQ